MVEGARETGEAGERNGGVEGLRKGTGLSGSLSRDGKAVSMRSRGSKRTLDQSKQGPDPLYPAAAVPL